MHLVISLLPVWVLGISSISTPVYFDRDTLPYVNATMPAISGETVIQMSLTPDSFASTLIFCDGNGYHNSWIPNVTLNVGDIRSVHPDVACIHVPENSSGDDGSVLASLGVGRGSPLVNDYGSVDFVKDSNRASSLIVGSTLDWFRNVACYENSLISVPYNVTSILDLLRFQVGIRDMEQIVTVDYLLTSSPFIVSLPEDQLSIIMGIIQVYPENYFRNFGSSVFGRCTQIRHRLPNLRLIVGDFEILLTPEDYTRELGEDDRCDLLVRSIPSSGQHVMNPFMFPDMNVRFTNETFYICDSMVTAETSLD